MKNFYIFIYYLMIPLFIFAFPLYSYWGWDALFNGSNLNGFTKIAVLLSIFTSIAYIPLVIIFINLRYKKSY